MAMFLEQICVSLLWRLRQRQRSCSGACTLVQSTRAYADDDVADAHDVVDVFSVQRQAVNLLI